MNRLLALCTSPDRGGLELYFIKFIKHYDDEKSVYVACSKDSYISKILLKRKLNVKPMVLKKYSQFHSIEEVYHKK